MAYGEIGRFSEAVETLEEAIQLKPGYAEARCNLGVVYYMREDKRSALREYIHSGSGLELSVFKGGI